MFQSQTIYFDEIWISSLPACKTLTNLFSKLRSVPFNLRLKIKYLHISRTEIFFFFIFFYLLKRNINGDDSMLVMEKSRRFYCSTFLPPLPRTEVCRWFLQIQHGWIANIKQVLCERGWIASKFLQPFNLALCVSKASRLELLPVTTLRSFVLIILVSAPYVPSYTERNSMKRLN